jgi:SARP family transcriptional regulator, regulator of embCAB operon
MLMVIVALRSSLGPAARVRLVDYLDPAGDLIARERVDELRMIGPDMALDPGDHLIVGLAPCDEPALAFDLPGHDGVAAIVEAGPFSYLGSNLGGRLEEISLPPGHRPRIQLCGRFVVELSGRRIDARLPSRQGRLLFAYLALNRERAHTRDELVDAVWPYAMPAAAASALTVLVSKLRAALGPGMVAGRSELRLNLPPAARVDVEDALEAVHQAQSAVALGEWRRAWGPALRAQFIARRRLLPEHDAPWLDQWRGRLDDVHDRALEAYAASCLGIGGTELPGAERAARTLLERSPLRETGYALLMDTLAAQGNTAEAMRVYDRARATLHEELGITPGRAIQQAHARLLGTRPDPSPAATSDGG